MNRVAYFVIILFSLLSVIFSGCNNVNNARLSSDSTKNMPELTIAAASDLKLAFTEIGRSFEKATNSKIIFSFGSTGQLTDQIENGAPFDIFAAANIAYIDYLKDKNLIIDDTQRVYGIGRIGLAMLKTNPIKINNLNDLLKPEIKKIAIANPKHAPYGLAAKQALESAGLWEKINEKLVYGKNISDTLMLIETGNADAGIIALSISNDEKINFQLIDDKLHTPIKQAIAVIKGSKHEDLSRSFINYINSKEGQEIMKKYGFIHPEDN
ncbi:molybdate ABC transporter substrate-binding protein [Vulcanibacillus modesticaldus]|uniref:Molybdate ABC transporter substrate-binding protein n=1 Tax=Vulcanibacillus modesticaldus TaxID=337097 RepID=A0A1D2YX44_9BACI|nr:molybdate ABC transporter substrate-binding protein [Vulcanibacillus modesticaldus]OEG00242.1 molybdate ABC transporter substrate-binding protein [Vulcanibacillus modesticaldus]